MIPYVHSLAILDTRSGQQGFKVAPKMFQTLGLDILWTALVRHLAALCPEAVKIQGYQHLKGTS